MKSQLTYSVIAMPFAVYFGMSASTTRAQPAPLASLCTDAKADVALLQSAANGLGNSVAANIATFKGEVASSFSLAHMFDLSHPVTLNASVGYSQEGSAGFRMGVGGEF